MSRSQPAALGHNGPEKVDREVHDNQSQKHLEKKIPKELECLGEGGGAGRALRGEGYRKLLKERLMLSKKATGPAYDTATATPRGKGKG